MVPSGCMAVSEMVTKSALASANRITFHSQNVFSLGKSRDAVLSSRKALSIGVDVDKDESPRKRRGSGPDEHEGWGNTSTGGTDCAARDNGDGLLGVTETSEGVNGLVKFGGNKSDKLGA